MLSMAIRKYPVGDQDRDHRISAKRDTNITFGDFGVVVYVYRLALEPVKSRSNKYVKGELYHPVDTPEDATYWLNYYKEKTQPSAFSKRPEYVDAYFIPKGPE